MKRPYFKYVPAETFTDADGTWHVERALLITADPPNPTWRHWSNLGADFRRSVRRVWRELRAS